MGKSIRASLLVLLLAAPAHAGWMGNDVTKTPPPPPEQAGAVQEPASCGEIPDDADGEIQNGVAGSLTGAALNLLAGLLAAV